MILLYCETCGLRIADAEIAELRAKKVSEFGWVCASCAGKPAAKTPTDAQSTVEMAPETVEMKAEPASQQRPRSAVIRSTGATGATGATSTKGKTATIPAKKSVERPAWHGALAGAGVVFVLAGLFALSRGSSEKDPVKGGSPAEPVAAAPVKERVNPEPKQSVTVNVQPQTPVTPSTMVDRMREAEKGGENIRDARAASLLKEHQAWFQSNPTKVFEYAQRLRDVAATFRSSPVAREAEQIAAELKIPDVKGRFVRIDLSGTKRILSLAEVQVYSNGSNVAPKGKATQSSISNNGQPARAIDGTTNGQYGSNSTTHSDVQDNPWWEVELPDETTIQSIVVWNRTDCCQERLKDLKVSVLGNDRQTVWSKTHSGTPPVKSVFEMK